MSRGHRIAIVGLILFLVMIIGGGAMFGDNPSAAQMIGSAAFLLLGLSFVVGSVLLAVDKHYHWLIGLIAGLFSPLGLLILTIMPTRKVASED